MKNLENVDLEYKKQGLTTSEYISIHMYIGKVKNKKGFCSICKKSNFKKTEWALIKGMKYCKDINNYMELCISCHKKYDYKETTRIKTSKRMRDYFLSNKDKLRLPKYNRFNHPANKKVIKLDKETGEEIKIYESVTQASLDVSGKVTGAIQNNIKGLSNTAYGFKWKYYE